MLEPFAFPIEKIDGSLKKRFRSPGSERLMFDRVGISFKMFSIVELTELE
jgi:hypothetical protein